MPRPRPKAGPKRKKATAVDANRAPNEPGKVRSASSVADPRSDDHDEGDPRQHERLRIALIRALNDGSKGAAWAIRGALSCVVDWDDDADRWALAMAVTGLDALIRRRSRDREAVRAWHATRNRSAPDSQALAILDLAHYVDHFARLYPLRAPGIVETGRVAIQGLQALLERRFGKRVPSVDDLEGWIARHAPKKQRGRLTTAGIVAKIVHQCRLLGTHHDDDARTLRRVTMVLKRHQYTPLV